MDVVIYISGRRVMTHDNIRYYHKYGKKGSKGLNLYTKFSLMAMKNPKIIKSAIGVATTRKIHQYINRRFWPENAPMPHAVNINVTRRCNLNCRMCVQHRQEGQQNPGLSWYDPKNELPVKIWEKAMDEMAPHRIWLGVTGGEPTLYPHMKEFVTTCVGKGIPLELTTNGLLLDSFAEFFVREGMEMIFVSVDGPEEIHDEIRGTKGAFKKTINGLQTLVAARDHFNSVSPVIIINTTISKMNLDHIDQVLQISKDVGADLHQFIHTEWSAPKIAASHNRIFNEEFCSRHGLEVAMPSLPDGEFYETQITKDDIPHMEKKIDQCKRVGAKLRMPIKMLPNLSAGMLYGYYCDPSHQFSEHCNSLWQKIRILPDGTVSPCMHIKLGNIKDQTVAEIWNGPQMRTFRRLISKNLYPACFRCCSRNYAGETIR
jgi:radical SAM protein with 4Fe4S-binding SPASM domain